LESGELFSDPGLTDDYYYIGYFDSGLAAGRLFIFQREIGQTEYIVASFTELPTTFPDPTPGSFPATIDTSAIVTTDVPFCFLPGTLIATASGERPIETLEIGDLVVTADQREVPVKWIGRQSVPLPALMPRNLEPVLIEKGALGHGLPHQDLRVSADHGIVLDGFVINASALVNGTTIRFFPMTEPFTYYHIETEQHDVVLANGIAAETFVDATARSAFENYQEYLDLYGEERKTVELPNRRISSRRMVPQSIRDRVSAPDQERLPDLKVAS
jgi:hypothetical protein